MCVFFKFQVPKDPWDKVVGLKKKKKKIEFLNWVFKIQTQHFAHSTEATREAGEAGAGVSQPPGHSGGSFSLVWP